MRRRFALLLAFAIAVGGSAARPQDASETVRRRVDRALEEETRRIRAEILELVRRELRGGDAAALERACAKVTEERLRRHAEYLASDELEGRAAGYPGNDKAAEYIAKVFKEAGLAPAGDGTTFFQKFRVGGRDTRNVLGAFEGSDPELQKEVVLLGAHFDHVGTADQRDFGRLGGTGNPDRIWNGADDNASGTSVLLAVAEAFGETGLRARRTIVFAAFSGEEAGLLGSRHYTQHPYRPIDRHVFMLNLDMVGRNPQKPVQIQGVGSAEGGAVRAIVERAVERAGLKARIEDEVTLLGGDSDHSSFRDRGVPYAFFWSGFHADYHRPSDHAEKLAYDNMARVGCAAVHILYEVGRLEPRPRFAPQARRPFGLPGLGAPSGRRLGVTVQELDDAACEELKLEAGQGGLRVEVVHPGGAAEGAGVKAEDVILSVAGTALPREGARERLREVLADKVKPGEPVDVVVLREGRRVTLKAQWDK
ncbi:MAG TPA: M20/M25/M40 family metallo-hydrolase [Planctomycetota bacterium]|nr:M20/M25/M40 family metallo-hydrolase [Planctomycetota bacterium]